jgi:small subunit ribosomal protein S18
MKLERKECYFGKKCDNIDYKDAQYLRRFINSQGKIYPPKRYNVSAKCQRRLSRDIKRARTMGLLPFVIR